ncbi:HNH endonuclease [Aquabacterium sp.]|uniref:HNH endonuclease n=1 Tax=Aquabacterium sp. TaxID=1872578 RepID=UPI003D0147C6
MSYMNASHARAHFTRERLHELFVYDPDSGRLMRRDTGKEIVGCNNHGYLQVWADGALLLAHRIAWRVMTGEWPRMLDHVNGVRTDNRFLNLRETNHSLNAQNYTKAMRTNKTGLLGVSVDKRSQVNQFRAAIRVSGAYIALGCFPTPDEAHSAYLKAKAVYHPTASLVSRQATVAASATGDDEPCSPMCPQGDCAGCAFTPARKPA